MSQNKRIFIIGHPGAGKTLLGKALAEKLGWQFINADSGLEIQIGRTLTEIVGMQGEKSFQQTELEILKSLCKKENIVVTTNGSIVCNEENRKILSSEFTVHLKVSTAVQINRTARNQTPLLMTDLKKFFDTLHLERDSLNNQVAALSINSDDSALDEHVLEIVNKISKDKTSSSLAQLEEKDRVIFHKTQHTPVHLTEQQAICLKLLIQGKSSKEIARDMNISYRTVEGYIANIMELTNCNSSKELVALYHQV